MQITPIGFNTRNYNRINTKSNTSSVSFEGYLKSVNIDSFKTETAKKIFAKTKKYLQLIGNEGTFKNQKILSKVGLAEEDVYLSVDKTALSTKIRLSGSKDSTLLEAYFNEKGQMIIGNHFNNDLYFERSGKNIRRIKNNGYTYMPVGNSDKDWDCFGKKLDTHIFRGEDPSYAAYEIFMELAKLKTSIFR